VSELSRLDRFVLAQGTHQATKKDFFNDSIISILMIPSIGKRILDLVVVVLPDPFRGMGAWRNSTETQQSGHALRSGPEVKILFIYLFYLRNQYTKIYERKDRKHRKIIFSYMAVLPKAK